MQIKMARLKRPIEALVTLQADSQLTPTLLPSRNGTKIVASPILSYRVILYGTMVAMTATTV
jgi:hypothetical protein